MENERTNAKSGPPAASEKQPGTITSEELKARGFKEHPPSGKAFVIGMPGPGPTKMPDDDSSPAG